MGAAASPARLSFVIGKFLSHRIRILSYTPQLPFKVGKFADSAKNAHPLNGVMNDDNQEVTDQPTITAVFMIIVLCYDNVY